MELPLLSTPNQTKPNKLDITANHQTIPNPTHKQKTKKTQTQTKNRLRTPRQTHKRLPNIL